MAHPFRRHRPRPHSALSGERIRLLEMRAQTTLHDGKRPQGLTRYRRRRARPYSRFGQHRSIPVVPPRAQEGRGAVCAHKAHSEARPVPAARPERRQRRGAAHRNRSEPSPARQTLISYPTNRSGLVSLVAQTDRTNRSHDAALLPIGGPGSSISDLQQNPAVENSRVLQHILAAFRRFGIPQRVPKSANFGVSASISSTRRRPHRRAHLATSIGGLAASVDVNQCMTSRKYPF